MVNNFLSRFTMIFNVFFNKWSPVDFYFKNFVLPQYYCLSLHCSVKAHILETWPQLVALLKVAYGRDFRRWHLVGGHNMLKASVPVSSLFLAPWCEACFSTVCHDICIPTTRNSAAGWAWTESFENSRQKGIFPYLSQDTRSET